MVATLGRFGPNSWTLLALPRAGDSGLGRGVFAALGRFGEDAGLDRSLEIAADLNNIARSSTLDGPIHLVRD